MTIVHKAEIHMRNSLILESDPACMILMQGSIACRFIKGSAVALTINDFLFIYLWCIELGLAHGASVKNLVSQVNSLGIFANCYLCSSIIASNKING